MTVVEKPFPSRSRLVFIAILSVTCVLIGGLGYERMKRSGGKTSQVPAVGEARIVSLSPGITETVVALGRGGRLVGVSDFCRFEGAPLPRVGSAITPAYEKIARLEPSLIVTSDVRGEQIEPLQAIAKTESLPWLTLEEWFDSTKRLGALIDARTRAEALVAEWKNEIERSVPADAPRVLLALDYGDTGENSVWFIKKNSIHGAVLRAAGARNAVDREVKGAPRLSPEQLLETDPDAIIVLLDEGKDERASRERFARYEPLRAVREKRIGVVEAPGALTVGPRVVGLIEPLTKAVRALTSPPENEEPGL